jgi:hypothetical protein
MLENKSPPANPNTYEFSNYLKIFYICKRIPGLILSNLY